MKLRACNHRLITASGLVLMTLLFLFLVPMNAHAQSSKLISAASYIDNGQYQKAYDALEEARQNEKTMNSERTYFQFLRLYTMIALDSTDAYGAISANPLMDARDAAVKTLELDEKKRMSGPVVIEADRLSRLMYNNGLTAYREADYAAAYDYFYASYEMHGVIHGYGKVEGRDTSTYYFAAICTDLAGNKEQAETMYRSLIDMNFKEPGVYSNLGKLYVSQEKLDQAERIFAEGRTKYPGSQELLIDELNYFLQQGRAPEAIDKFKLAIANDPDNSELHFAMGTAYQALINLDMENSRKHMADARAAYGRAIELNPQSFDAYLNTGALYYNEGVLLQEELNNLDLSEEDRANELVNEQKDLYRQALPFFQNAARVYEEMPEESKVDAFYAVEVYRSLKEIQVRLGDYAASNEAKKRMEELEALREK